MVGEWWGRPKGARRTSQELPGAPKNLQDSSGAARSFQEHPRAHRAKICLVILVVMTGSRLDMGTRLEL